MRVAERENRELRCANEVLKAASAQYDGSLSGVEQLRRVRRWLVPQAIRRGQNSCGIYGSRKKELTSVVTMSG